MSAFADSAIDSLQASAAAAGSARLDQRLMDVQQLLADDLRWVERTLLEGADVGTEPAASAARHLVARGGKRVRPTAVLLSAACIGQIPGAARELAVVVELVHTATLLHDDVIDEGRLRRGAEAARLIWGNAVSVLAGDTLLVHSLERTARHAPQLMHALLTTLQRLVSGEIRQLRGRTRLDLSLRTYERILDDKTASLFRFATSSGALLAGATQEQQVALGGFGERVGMAFQLVDDVLDYASEESGKALGVDLMEGKVTLPLVLAADKHPELLARVERVRAGERDEVEVLRRAVVASGACELVRRRAEQETKTALEALRVLPESPARRLLTAVARHLVTRGA